MARNVLREVPQPKLLASNFGSARQQRGADERHEAPELIVLDSIVPGPGGADYPNHITYREVDPGRRLVDVHGEAVAPDPSFTGVVTFEEMAGTTALSLRLVFDSEQDRDLVAEKYHAVEGGEQTLGRLGALLAA